MTIATVAATAAAATRGALRRQLWRLRATGLAATDVATAGGAFVADVIWGAPAPRSARPQAPQKPRPSATRAPQFGQNMASSCRRGAAPATSVACSMGILHFPCACRQVCGRLCPRRARQGYLTSTLQCRWHIPVQTHIVCVCAGKEKRILRKNVPCEGDVTERRALQTGGGARDDGPSRDGPGAWPSHRGPVKCTFSSS